MIYYNMKYIIYKIQIKDYIYIGSTKNFTIRKASHKRDCNNGKDFLVYNTIRENGGWECCTIVPIREVEVETILQARIIEEEERVKYNAQMNAIRAYITEDEKLAYVNYWREENKEKRAETGKLWYEANKEKRAETQKIWYEANKERVAEYGRKRYAAKKAEQTSQPNV
jgi:hypothetical protein